MQQVPELNELAAKLQHAWEEMTVLPDGTAVVVDLQGNRIFTFSDTGAFLVQQLRDGVSDMSRLSAVLCEHFEVEEDQAHRDIAEFLATLMKQLDLPDDQSPT
jgi:hypothetical protein